MSVAVDIYAELNGAPFAANDNAVTANGNYRYDGKLKRVTGTEGLYEHADLLGSPRRLTNVSGSPDEKAFHSPFGMEYGNTNPLRSIKDKATGLAATVAFYGYIRSPRPNIRLRLPPTNYMQARYYDPVMGRFLSVDPVTFLDTGVTAQFNRYSYTANDPINWTDPNGECPWCLGAIIGGAIELGVQLSSAEGRQAYADAGRALANGDFSGALSAAGSNLAKVGISAGAGAVGAFGATKVAQGASAVARTSNSVRAAEVTNILGNVAGNTVVGAGVGAGQQATKNVALGENGSVGVAAYGGAIGGALGATAGSLIRGNTGNLADATGRVIGSPNGTLTAPLVGRSAAPEAIGEIAGAAVATTGDMGARCSIDVC